MSDGKCKSWHCHLAIYRQLSYCKLMPCTGTISLAPFPPSTHPSWVAAISFIILSLRKNCKKLRVFPLYFFEMLLPCQAIKCYHKKYFPSQRTHKKWVVGARSWRGCRMCEWDRQTSKQKLLATHTHAHMCSQWKLQIELP